MGNKHLRANKRIGVLVALILACGIWVAADTGSVVNGDLAVNGNAGTANGEYLRQFDIGTDAEAFTFMVFYYAGDPEVTLVPPAGTTALGDETISRFPNGIAITRQAVAGRWTAKIANMPGKDGFEVKVMTSAKRPGIQFIAPTGTSVDSDGTVSVVARFSNIVGTHGVQLLAGESQETDSGVPIGEGTVSQDGTVTLAGDLRQLSEGNYYLILKLDMGEATPVTARCPATLRLQYRSALQAPTKLIVSGDSQGILRASWELAQPGQVKECVVRLFKPDGSIEDVNLGTGTSALLKNFTPGTTIGFQVIAFDASGRQAASEKLSVKFADPAIISNQPQLNQKTLTVDHLLGTEPPVVKLSIKKNFVKKGDAGDYVYVVAEIPRSIGMQEEGEDWSINAVPDKRRYAAADGETDYTLYLSIPSGTPAGTYTFPVRVVNLGDPRQSDSLQLTLNVKSPPVSISGVTPSSWFNGPRPALSIKGSGFLSGTRVYLDGTEVSVAEAAVNELTIAPGNGLSIGEHTVKVVSPGGSASSKVTVESPRYMLFVQKSQSQALRNATASFWLGVKSADGFSGSVNFRVLAKPSGWTVNLDKGAVGVGDSLRVDAAVPARAALGKYVVTVGDGLGNQADLNIEVVNKVAGPTISSLSFPSGLPGQEILIYGYGFGTSGSLSLAGKSLVSSSWSDQLIRFVIPNDAKSGKIQVQTGGQSSGTLYFLVMESQFSLSLDKSELRRQPGDQIEVKVVLNGLPKAVNLSAEANDPAILLSLKDTSVVPAGGTVLTIRIGSNIANGVYAVTVKGLSDGYTNFRTLQLVVGNAFELPVQALPSAKQGSRYRYQLISKNGNAPVKFSLIDGQLPGGMELGSGGVIQGVPGMSGSYSLTVQANDADGRSRSAKLTLFVDENVWNMPSGDDGRSNFAPGEAPADQRTGWSQPSDGKGQGLLSGANKLFALTDAGICARDPETGAVAYRIGGSYTALSYRRGRLAAVDAKANLIVFDASTGKESWRREGVKSAFAFDTVLLAQTAGEVLQLDLADGHLIANEAGAIDGQFYIWNGSLVRLTAGRLEKLGEKGWVQVVAGENSAVVAAAFDAKGALIAFAGKVAEIDNTGAVLAETAARDVKRLVLADGWVAISGTGSTLVCKRGSLEKMSTPDLKAATQLAASDDRLFSLSSKGLQAWNVYAGTLVWASDLPSVGFLLRAGKLFSLGIDGRLTRYDAPDNISAPVSVLSVVPPLPNGKNGWYTTKPVISLSATDKETYAKKVLWNAGSSTEVSNYAGPVTLGEGVHQVRYCAVDTWDLREVDQITALSVDSLAPVTAIQTVPATSGPYYLGPVRVTLKASDEGSGLLGSEFNLNNAGWKAYDGREFRFDHEGINSLAVRSVDLAGNIEPGNIRQFIVDLAPPDVGLEWHARGGVAMVYLYASDNSGIDRIEYSIDGGKSVAYDEALCLNSGGTWKLSYHAVDKAGRDSGWKTEVIRVNGDRDRLLVDGIHYYDNKPRRTVEDAQNGMVTFSATHKPDLFKTLPAELKGYLYFLNSEQDGLYKGKELFGFTAADELVVYVLRDSASQAAYPGYDKVRDYGAGQLSATYFRKGASLLRRQFAKGETVSIPGAGLSSPGGDAIFAGSLPWDGLAISLPRPGMELVAGESYPLSYGGQVTLQKARWQFRMEDSRWIEIVDPAKGFIVPKAEDGSRIEIRVGGIANGKEIQAGGVWAIKNLSGIQFQGINEHGTVFAGVSFNPQGIVMDASGNLMAQYPVVYTISVGGKALAQGSGPFTIARPGEYALMAVADVDGTVMRQSATLRVLPKGGWTHAFHPKHPRMPGRYMDGRKNYFDVEFDKWKEKDSWDIRVPNGWYEVRLVLLPSKAWTVFGCYLNGYSGNLTSKEAERLHAATFQVQVNDGKLHFRGGEDLPLVRLEYRKIDDLSRPSFREDGILNGLEN